MGGIEDNENTKAGRKYKWEKVSVIPHPQRVGEMGEGSAEWLTERKWVRRESQNKSRTCAKMANYSVVSSAKYCHDVPDIKHVCFLC